MKKVSILMSLLLTLGLFSACSSDDEANVSGSDGSTMIPEDGVVLSPVNFWNEDDIVWNTSLYPLLNPILGNIEEELPLLGNSKGFFVGSEKNECYVINSLEELKSIYTGDLEMPETGFFEQYTLVIGQEFMPDCNYPVYKQDLMFNDHKCHLTLYVPDYDSDPDYKPLQHLYYFGVYPKFYTEGISVGIIKEKSILESVEDVPAYVWINPDGDNNHYYKCLNPYDGYIIYDASDPNIVSPWKYYYPINLPEDFVVDEIDGTEVKFSGKIIELHREALDQLQAPRYATHSYIVYLTKIEVKEVDYDAGIPYRGVVPFTITDMPGMVGYDWDNDSWFITYVKDNTMVNRYYPKELSEEFKHPGLNVIISGNVYEDISKSKRIKHYKIELTKIEEAE